MLISLNCALYEFDRKFKPRTHTIVNNPYSEIEVKPGRILRVYTKKETWDIERKWVEIFCKHKQGANTKAYKWNIFSYNRYPSKSGNKALDEYIQQNALEYIVLSNAHELAIETDHLPQECNISDYYVFPKNMAWTMAFTHEDGWLGPYFARLPQYDVLNQENEARLRKRDEVEFAKKKGWL